VGKCVAGEYDEKRTLLNRRAGTAGLILVSLRCWRLELAVHRSRKRESTEYAGVDLGIQIGAPIRSTNDCMYQDVLVYWRVGTQGQQGTAHNSPGGMIEAEWGFWREGWR